MSKMQPKKTIRESLGDAIVVLVMLFLSASFFSLYYWCLQEVVLA